MSKVQKTITWTIIASESTHIFCCVLPTVISIFSLLSGLGLTTVLPMGLLRFHDMMHPYEIPLIIFSACILVMGWGLNMISEKLDCRTDGLCCHEPCAPKKNTATKVLWVATVLFSFNVFMYFTFHRHMDYFVSEAQHQHAMAMGHQRDMEINHEHVH